MTSATCCVGYLCQYDTTSSTDYSCQPTPSCVGLYGDCSTGIGCCSGEVCETRGGGTGPSNLCEDGTCTADGNLCTPCLSTCCGSDTCVSNGSEYLCTATSCTPEYGDCSALDCCSPYTCYATGGTPAYECE